MPLDSSKNQYAPSAAITSLSTSVPGATDDTIVAAGVSYTEANLNANFKDLMAKINAILAALRTAGIIVS